MTKMEVFDPPMCCPTGVCGPAIDPALVQFAAGLDWLRKQGVSVQRFNLSQQPGAFAANETVRRALDEKKGDCLPLILIDDQVFCEGRYPSREELASLVENGDSQQASLYSPAVAELVAIGASIAANCERCFKYHFAQAKKLGVTCEDMACAVDTARRVKNAPAQAILEMAERFLNCAVTPVEDAMSTEANPQRCC